MKGQKFIIDEVKKKKKKTLAGKREVAQAILEAEQIKEA